MKNIRELVQVLNFAGKKSLERSVHRAVKQKHYAVELSHWLMSLLEDRTILQLVLKEELDLLRLSWEAEAYLDALPKVVAVTPTFDESLVMVLNAADKFAQAEHAELHSGHLLLAMITESERLPHFLKNSLGVLDPLALQAKISIAKSASIEGIAAEPQAKVQNMLNRYTQNLTEKARNGKIDPVFGRQAEVQEMMDILLRRRQNNPIIIGEAGVGKTALVEGLALKIAAKEVPAELRDIELHLLDLTLLQAGASVKGEFEERLKTLLAEIQTSPMPIILFIDEIHTLIGAGGPAGQQDAANILKPSLARGELRTIGATTLSEYKKYFEKDSALVRRFQTVLVDEPSLKEAEDILYTLVPQFEAHHGVAIVPDAIPAAVELSARYLPARQLPDKAISLLDTACAHVRLSTNKPLSVNVLEEELALIQLRLGRNQLALPDQVMLMAKQQALSEQIASLTQVWQENKAIKPVDREAVAEVLTQMTGIPLCSMLEEELTGLLNLNERLKTAISGQDFALEKLGNSIKVAKSGLADPNKPLGVFLLAGPSGVGKTETALNIAKLLFGHEDALTVINMSEFKEAHKVSLLTGSPPGYVGYGEGGILTEPIRHRPYSVLLLDEVDKAHESVMDLFYQVFDKGSLADGEGRIVNFRNTLIIMTANLGVEAIEKNASHCKSSKQYNALSDHLEQELVRHFKPALLSRFKIVPYLPLTHESLTVIAQQKIKLVQERVKHKYAIELKLAPEVIHHVVGSSIAHISGARFIDKWLLEILLTKLSEMILMKQRANQLPERIEVTLKQGEIRITARGKQTS
jgi:type VI secretion system protein VasG